MTTARRWWVALACAALLAGSLAAGCGGGESEGGTDGQAATTAGELTPVDIGILGISADAPIWIGMEQGFFEEEGIKVRPQVSGAGGSAFVPALLGGELDVGAGGADGAIQAMAKGLDVKILAHEGAPVSHGHTAAGTDDTHITLAVMSGAGSDVRSVEDLEGKTVAAITVSGLQYLCVQRAMELAGADPKTVEVLETPLPDMLPAMEAGRIDAAVLLEPFVSQAKASGANVVSYACQEAIPGVIQGAYFTSGEWASENPEVAAGLARALVRSNRYAQEHPDEQRRVIAENTQIPPKAAEQMALYAFPAPEERPRPNTLDAIAELMVRYGHIEAAPDLEAGLTQ